MRQSALLPAKKSFQKIPLIVDSIQRKSFLTYGISSVFLGTQKLSYYISLNETLTTVGLGGACNPMCTQWGPGPTGPNEFESRWGPGAMGPVGSPMGPEGPCNPWPPTSARSLAPKPRGVPTEGIPTGVLYVLMTLYGHMPLFLKKYLLMLRDLLILQANTQRKQLS